jgi:hypothetical protein
MMPANPDLTAAAVEAMARAAWGKLSMPSMMEAALTALLALLQDRGWRIVPEEPTQDMLRAAGKADDASAVGNGRDAGCEEHWDAMLSASPSPFAGEAGGGG